MIIIDARFKYENKFIILIAADDNTPKPVVGTDYPKAD